MSSIYIVIPILTRSYIIKKAIVSVPFIKTVSFIPIVKTSILNKQSIIILSDKKEGFIFKKRKVLSEKFKTFIKIKIEAKRQNLGSSTPIKKFIRNKRVKIGSFFNNKSSNRDSILSASPLFYVYNIVNFFKKE